MVKEYIPTKKEMEGIGFVLETEPWTPEYDPNYDPIRYWSLRTKEKHVRLYLGPPWDHNRLRLVIFNSKNPKPVYDRFITPVNFSEVRSNIVRGLMK